MTFEEILDEVIAMLQRRGSVTYRTLKRQFNLDDDAFEDLKDELLYAHAHVVDDDGRGLVWTGEARPTPTLGSPPAKDQARAPLSCTPPYLAEKILTSKSVLEGDRKQVTVLFADLKASLGLLADRDPEDARAILDPVLERMMAAVHRYEGTVNQVMGDGIMALFGASIAHEDHAVRACYAALAMQDAIRRYSEEVRRAQGLEVQIRVGLNSGESALFPSGDFGRVLVYLREAESLAVAIDDPRRLGQVTNFLSVHFYRMGAYDQSIAAAQRVLAFAMASGEVVLHALANLRLGIAYHAQGEYRRAIDAFTQTVTALDGAQRRERLGQVNLPAVLSRACLAACHAELGTFTEGRAPGDKGMRIAEVVDHPASLMAALWGSVCWPCAKATCPGPSPSSNGP